jgi:hypothetical protein
LLTRQNAAQVVTSCAVGTCRAWVDRHAVSHADRGFVIVAKFYDVESGRITVENRGKGNAHEQLDIRIARDGGIADLLAEAKRADRRFVAVVVESIERVARVTYFSTKIEFELEKAGVALLAADEGIDGRSIPNLDHGLR